MMNIQALLIVSAVNIAAVVLVYFLLKKIEKKERILFIAISIAVIYMMLSVVYMLSSIGIDSEAAEKAQSFATYLFVPINMIITVPFIAKGYEKYKMKKIEKKQLINRCIASVIVILIIFLIEFFFFRSMQLNIDNFPFLS